jgi:hypothetical protein
MSTMQVDVKVYEPDGSTPRETYTEIVGEKADEEMVIRNLTFDVNAIGGLGDCNFIIFKNHDDVDSQVGDVVKIESASVVVYMGVITRISPDRGTSFPLHEDKVFVQVESLLRRSDRLIYNLEESDGSRVATNIQDVYDDIFQGGEFVDKNQDNNKDLETEIALIDYDPADNVLPSFSINVAYNGVSAASAWRDILEMARGQVDLTAAETYIMYLKTNGEIHTKQREDDTSPLLTVDIGSGNFPVKNSTYLEDDGFLWSEDTANIINEVILNDTVITSTQYASEVAASISTHGTRQYTINNDRVNIAETSAWLDGFILGLLESATTYSLHLNRVTYGFNPVWFSGGANVPDGYIKITKNAGGATVANVPFQSAIYTLDSAGWDINIVCGDIRPNINTRTNVLVEPANTDGLSIDVSVYVPASEIEDFNVPSIIQVSANDSFRLKLNYGGQPVTVTATYSGTPVTLNKSTDPDEPYYYITDDIAAPSKGNYKVIKALATDAFGKEVVSYHYVKGVTMPSSGVPVTVTDSDTAADKDTMSAPEFTNKIKFEFQYNHDFYAVAVTDVKLLFYTVAGALVKTLTSLSSPAITQPTVGNFVCDTTVAALGLSAGYYRVKTEITKHETYTDESGTPHDGTAVDTGTPYTFRIIGATTTSIVDTNVDFVDDHDTRLPVAEKETKQTYDPGSGDVDAKLKFFSTSIPDGGGVGWFVTHDDSVPGNWARITGDFTGTPDETFTINNDQTTEQYISLKFDTSSGTDKGIIRFDKTAKKIEMSVNNGSSWTDVATGVDNLIGDTYSSDFYEWKVNSSDGSVTFIQDPSGTPTTLFKITAAGEIKTYDFLEPAVDAQDDIGSETKRYASVYLSDILYTEDIVFTQDGGSTEVGKLELDATNSQIIPHKFAIGFMDG